MFCKLKSKKLAKTWDKWLRIYVMGLVAVVPDRDGDRGLTFVLPETSGEGVHDHAQPGREGTHHAVLTFGAELAPCAGWRYPVEQLYDGLEIGENLGVRCPPRGWILEGDEVSLTGGIKGCLTSNEPKRNLWQHLRWLKRWLFKDHFQPYSIDDGATTQWLPTVRRSRWRKSPVAHNALAPEPCGVVGRMQVHDVVARFSTVLLTSLPARPQCRRLAGTVPSLQFVNSKYDLQRSPQAMAEVVALDIAYDDRHGAPEIALYEFGSLHPHRCVALKPLEASGRIEVLLANLTALGDCEYDPPGEPHFDEYYQLVDGVADERRLVPTPFRLAQQTNVADVLPKFLPEILHEVSDHAKKGGLARPICTTASTGALTVPALASGAELLSRLVGGEDEPQCCDPTDGESCREAEIPPLCRQTPPDPCRPRLMTGRPNPRCLEEGDEP